MSTKQLVRAIFSTILKVVIYVAVVFFIYKGATIAYDYGFRVFKEEPMTQAPGVDINVEITMGKSALQIGEILESKGLIRDAKLFYLQNLLSAYKNKLRPGEYTLNTSMTMVEMIAVMAAEPVEEEPEDNTGGDTTKEASDVQETGFSGEEDGYAGEEENGFTGEEE